MSVSDSDLKILWGRAAGFCSNPGCLRDLTVIIESGSFNIGEMAHVIAKSDKGPRGIEGISDNTYKNLILLCPNCHRIIDKAPKGAYTEEKIFGWKDKAEARRDAAFVSQDVFILEDVFTLGYNAFHLMNNLRILKDNREILTPDWLGFLFQCINRVKFHAESIGRLKDFSDKISEAYRTMSLYQVDAKKSYSLLLYSIAGLNGEIKRKFVKDKEKKIIYLSENLANLVYLNELKIDASQRGRSMSNSEKSKIFKEYEQTKDLYINIVSELTDNKDHVDGVFRAINTGDEAERADAIYKATTHMINSIGG